MLGRMRGSSITIFGQSFSFFADFDTVPEKPRDPAAPVWFLVVCGCEGMKEPVAGACISMGFLFVYIPESSRTTPLELAGRPPVFLNSFLSSANDPWPDDSRLIIIEPNASPS